MDEMKTAYDENGIAYLIEAEGSEAKHIVDLLMAEAQGRLIILPCKVGDTVYYIANPCDDSCCFWKNNDMENCLEEKCQNYIIKKTELTLRFWNYHDSDLGSKLFVTKEEAEAALKAVQND